MKARAIVSVALASSLLVGACAHRASVPDVPAPPREERAVEPRPPPGTRIDTWPDLGVWSVTGRELPGSTDLFLWEKAAAPVPPKAQIPLRLHRPVD
jgi:hypothetical protein